MLAFWMAYKIKILTGLAIVLFFAWGFKIWLNKHDAKVTKEAEIATVERERKVNEKKWEARDAEIKKALETAHAQLWELEGIRKNVEQMRIDASAQRKAADTVYNQTIALIQKEKERTNEIVNSIPAGQLVNSIIIQSGQLPSSIRRSTTDPARPVN